MRCILKVSLGEHVQSMADTKMHLQSSWLRDALSEIDPSCEKLTFHGHPVEEGNRHVSSKPLLRIHADGVFGTTEVSRKTGLLHSTLRIVKMDYPNDKEVLETFECPSPVSFR